MEVNPVIVVPLHKATLSEAERISIECLTKTLKRYEIRSALPLGLSHCELPFRQEYFDSHFFDSLFDYNRLMLSEDFYQRFTDFSHILIYQPDALVLRDELEMWCNSDLDYVGATWYRELIEFYEKVPWPFAGSGCGNGGFSLRRVNSFLRHLQSRKGIWSEVTRLLHSRRVSDARSVIRFRDHL